MSTKNQNSPQEPRTIADFPRVVLASQSPRRQEILRNHGIDPCILPADITETIPTDMIPSEVPMFLALKKALSVETEHPELEGSLIIASDTIVLKDRILGKPENQSDAYAMIDAIRGTTHQVVTGVALVEAGMQNKRVFCDITTVYCNDLSHDEILTYINTDEPYDKAGGYAIQGTFGKYIDHIDGDYENVVGLPYEHMIKEIERL
jgi:septum formation protein